MQRFWALQKGRDWIGAQFSSRSGRLLVSVEDLSRSERRFRTQTKSMKQGGSSDFLHRCDEGSAGALRTPADLWRFAHP